MRVRLTPERGDPIEYVGGYDAFENYAGGAFAFDISTRTGDVETERYRGRADRPQFAATAVAEYETPQSTLINLPGEVYFPLHHVAAVLTAARNGERRFSGLVFAGSRPHGAPHTAETGIEGPFPPAQDSSTDALVDASWWRLHTTYFTRHATAPSYEIVQEIHDNGVTREFVFDYGGLVLEARLISVAANAAAQCAPEGAPEDRPPG